MFGNIPEIYICVAFASLAVVVWMAITQWSEFVDHQKSTTHDKDAAEKFAVVPYLLIPLLGCAISVLGALWCGDWLNCHGYVSGAEETCGVTVGVAVVIYCLVDKYLLAELGNSTYFKTIESKVADTVKSASEYSDEDIAFLEAVKRMKAQK